MAEITPLLQVKDVCRVLGVSRSKLYALMKEQPALEPLRLGRLVRWRTEDISAFIAGYPKQSANGESNGESGEAQAA